MDQDRIQVVGSALAPDTMVARADITKSGDVDYFKFTTPDQTSMAGGVTSFFPASTPSMIPIWQLSRIQPGRLLRRCWHLPREGHAVAPSSFMLWY